MIRPQRPAADVLADIEAVLDQHTPAPPEPPPPVASGTGGSWEEEAMRWKPGERRQHWLREAHRARRTAESDRSFASAFIPDTSADTDPTDPGRLRPRLYLMRDTYRFIEEINSYQAPSLITPDSRVFTEADSRTALALLPEAAASHRVILVLADTWRDFERWRDEWQTPRSCREIVGVASGRDLPRIRSILAVAVVMLDRWLCNPDYAEMRAVALSRLRPPIEGTS